MTYFPEPAWSNIVSYLVDPYKRDREAHAEVWQKIRVQRYMCTTSVVYEGDFTEEHQCEYVVYVHDPNIGGLECATMPTANFGVDDMSGEWENVGHDLEMWNPDGSYLGTTCEWHNYQHDQYR